MGALDVDKKNSTKIIDLNNKLETENFSNNVELLRTSIPTSDQGIGTTYTCYLDNLLLVCTFLLLMGMVLARLVFIVRTVHLGRLDREMTEPVFDHR